MFQQSNYNYNYNYLKIVINCNCKITTTAIAITHIMATTNNTAAMAIPMCRSANRG